MKHWWAYNSPRKKAKPKGFWIETLTGENFDPNKKTYAEQFITILEKVANKYAYYKWLDKPPTLNDPSLAGEYLQTSMTIEDFRVFMDIVNQSLVLAYQARDADIYDGSRLWNKLFGDEFPVTEKIESSQRSLPESFTDEYYSRQERFLFRDFGIKSVSNKFAFQVDCIVSQNGFRDFCLRDTKKPLLKGCNLRFFIKHSSIPFEHKILWKVKNTGVEAKSVNQLRGEITPDTGSGMKQESTYYRGMHYVECYAVDDKNRCIAKDRLYVNIV